MLAYVLAIIIAIGSFSFYMAAFFVPEMHRRQDFLWSGLGLFYAVVLWFCAGRITGAVLLGQIASVALLTGLSWHTLALRRDLTPELVRTPITWADLQRWGHRLQQVIQQYFKLNDLLRGLQTLGADLGRAIAEFRRRTAGPRGLDSTAGVPPLKRSPAYEFETAPGESQPVPSEFATVARPPVTADPDAAPAVAAQEAAQAPAEQEAEAVVQPTMTDAVAAPPATTPEEPAPTSEKSAPAARSQRPLAAPSKPQGKPQGRGILAAWRQPKRERAVVEIPPRPPSIPRSPKPEAAPPPTPPPKAGKGASGRAVIDIPPRPPS
ncbi:MAG TPA: Ycf66 family protein, partial [Candidatus Obscuribacterales bacterium]